ncbi:transglutaminase-like putative cysteine protease [Amycolatopsis lexingtonensis]|uniref:Transglutaminase-like putative cysteine protease n=1 Tax=Amycolatopsis lexingtonensis TaxID=218822 RepID=A0ABR9HXB1_9PSEU|nr:transglutaminaseTgpA domain-containing protein [Amycolatopsis lexingtonensis]MBE1495552.1 transglutaminase-like putative cysteine protease [Amycolatopsis lexingtonensis]
MAARRGRRHPGGRSVKRAAVLNRAAVAGVLGSGAVAGLLFTPVFGFAAVLVPVLVVVVLAYACAELCTRWPKTAPYRPLLVLATGLLGLIEAVAFPTTLAGLPTGESLAVLVRGATEGWLLTLQSTWPARPVPEQLLFVPLAVLLASVVGLEVLLRLRKPLLAVLPGLLVAALSQAYQPLSGPAAVGAAVLYAGVAALALWSRPDRSRGGSGGWLVVATVAGLLAGAAAFGALDPAGREPVRLTDGQVAPLAQHGLGNPLDQVGERLARPGAEVFRYRGDAPVDRWRLAVLDGFDGAGWTTDLRLRRLGQHLESDGVLRSADVRVTGLPGPWLPSQPVPTGVTGVDPLVDETAGALLLDPPAPDPRYRLTWSSPDVDAARLEGAEVDAKAEGGLGELGQVPADVEQLARDAVRGLRPTFQSALQLERFLSTNYQVAVGTDLPTGHGWPQLRRFLLDTRRGTSEQFAAAYVALARLTGIPARLVVGFSGSSEVDGDYRVVRNRDVLAWPEVAVDGVGWVPLDPTAAAAKTGQQTGLAKATALARQQLPPEQSLQPPQLPPDHPESGDADASTGGSVRWDVVAAIAAGALLVGWLWGVPLAKGIRTRRRRRSTGAEGVIGAWAEARDRLRADGVPYRVGMTPRDLAELAGEGTREPITRLGKVLDMALWSGVPVTEGAVRRAWQEVGELRRSLATRPWTTRLRSALDPRTLLPPARRR